ncbi:Cna B-type domain-containing protein [Filifactor villosus]|uniref:Cna B-type domain-containing protein n=1 Tax=Filifactor villosus TaxID=29374 RepID=A0ABV9QHK5_9FIRM
MKLRRLMVALLTLLTLVASSLSDLSFVEAQTQPKKLENVVTDFKMVNLVGQPVQHTNHKYKMVINGPYAITTKFNLDAYNGNLNDGDFFEISVGEGFSMQSGGVELKVNLRNGQQLAIADLAFVSNGGVDGGKAVVTLKNLEQYRNLQGYDMVKNIYGNVNISVKTGPSPVDNKVVPIGGVTGVSQIEITTARNVSNPIAVNGEILRKRGGEVRGGAEGTYDSPALGKRGQHAHLWSLAINRAEREFDTLTVIDNISREGAPMQFIPEKIRLLKGEYEPDTYNIRNIQTLVKDRDYTIEYLDNFTTFKLTIPNSGKGQYAFIYYTTAPLDGSNVGNEALIQDNGQTLRPRNGATGDKISAHSVSKDLQGGSIAIDVSNRIFLYKVDEDDMTKGLAGAVFTIKNTANAEEPIELAPTNERGFTYTEHKLPNGIYEIEEKTAPLGYERNPEKLTVTLGSSGITRTITNKKRQIPLIAINVEKQWVAGAEDAKPESITLRLKENGEFKGKTLELRADAQWKGRFENLPKTDDRHMDIAYEVEEVGVAGYKGEVSVLDETDVLITNTKTVDLSVRKEWELTLGETTPLDEITVVLKPGDKELVLKAQNGWQGSFDSLPKYMPSGEVISYTIEEKDIPQGYRAVITGDMENGFLVKNEKEPPATKDIHIRKEWVGDIAGPVTIALLKNGQAEGTEFVLDENNRWQGVFANLPRKDDGGNVIDYSVEEVDVPSGYDVHVRINDEVNGFLITNTKRADHNGGGGTSPDPDNPGTNPNTPGDSNNPGTNPNTPGDSNNPGTNPNTPGDSNSPGTNPNTPGDSNSPGTNPNTPGDSNNPGTNPNTPGDSNSPGTNPNTPGDSNSPGTNPNTPGDSSNPGTNPNTPGDSSNPGTNPNTPGDSNNPGTNPNTPGDSSNPGTNPNTPGDSSNPGTNPNTPGDSSNPGTNPNTPGDQNGTDHSNRDDREDRSDREDRVDHAGDRDMSEYGSTSDNPISTGTLTTEEVVSRPTNDNNSQEEVVSARTDKEAREVLSNQREGEQTEHAASKQIKEQTKKTNKLQTAPESAGVVREAKANRVRRTVPKTGVLDNVGMPFAFSAIPGLLLLVFGLRRKYK